MSDLPTELEKAFTLIEDKELLKEKIQDLQESLLALPQLEIEINHYFSKDVYAREMKMPKDSLIIGKIHKEQNLNILSQGEVSILSVDGVMRVKAPFTFVASPGSKRVFYAHTEAVWTVIHGSNETDLEKLEEQFIAKTYDEVNYLTEQELKLLKGE